MIVEKVERKVITSCDAVQRRFRIDAGGLVNILSILRKNMYANPTRIIVQEYASNARDAHVEAGIPSKPIQITCPTSISPYLKIRDFGIGITPERIDDVFVAYGASTKRHTNEMVGGWGLGAKSAFSYCDAFEVTTIYNGIKYIYAPHIDESDIGEMPLIVAEETDEPSGTLISIPIKDEDIYSVNNAIAFVTENWAVRPELVGSVNYSNRKVYFSESNWALMEKSYSWQTNDILYCVEGIPYTFDIPNGDERFASELKELAKCPFVVKLKTGDVTIASNREALVSDDKTISKIHAILSEINDHFRNHVMESIEKCDTLKEMFEMRAMYNRLRLDHMIRSFVWNGITVTGAHLTIPADVGVVHKIKVTKRGSEVGRGFALKTSSTGEHVDFSDPVNQFIFTTTVEEGKSYNKNQLLNAMLTDRSLMECQLIVLKVPENDPILEEIGFKYFDKISLSEYPTKNIWRAKKFGILPKYEYYEFSGPSSTPTDNWTRKTGEVCDLEEGIYFPLYRGKIDLDREFFSTFTKSCSMAIYGIPSKSMDDAEDNPNLIDYKLYLEFYCDKLIRYILENEEDAAIVCGKKDHTFENTFGRIAKFSNNLSPDHLISIWKSTSQKFSKNKLDDIKTAVHRYNYFAPYIGRAEYKPANSLKNMHDLIVETYPMLTMYESGKSYNYNGKEDHFYTAVSSYVDMVDTQIALESEK
jgi:hypothetical protein